MVDPTGTFLGNMLGLDPQSAGQFQAARDQMGGIGMAQGALQNSGFHFPGGVTLAPGAAGLLGMMQAQAAVPQEALQAAQAGNQTAEAMYRRLQGQELLAKLPLYQQAVAEGSGIRPPGQPGQPALGQPGQQPQPGIGSGAVLPGGLPLHSVQNAIWKTESGGKVDGVSDGSSGEIGPMQIMPDTGKMFGASIDDLRDNNRNLQVGGSIIANYAQKYNGDPLAIAVAYNAGPGAADKWLAAGRDPSVLPKSTRDVYLPKFQENLSNFAQAAPAQGAPGAPSPVMAGNAAPMGSPAPAPSAAPPTMQTPPGMTQADVDAANTRIRRNQLLGIPVNPQDQAVVTYGLDVGKAGATTRQQKEIELQYSPSLFPYSRQGAPRAEQFYNPNTGAYEPRWIQPPVPQLPGQAAVGGSMPPQMPGAGAGTVSPVPGAQTPMTPSIAPAGPQTVPMLPSQPAPGSSMVPGGAQGLMPGSLGISKPGPLATEIPAIPPGATGPGYTENENLPVSPSHPYPSINPALKDMPSMYVSDNKTADDNITKYRDLGGKVVGAMPDIQRGIETQMGLANVLSRYESGAFGTNIAEFKSALKTALPWMDVSQINNPADAEKILHDNTNATLTILKGTGLQRWAQSEFLAIGKNNQNPNLRPSANFHITAENVAPMMQANAFVQDYMAARNRSNKTALDPDAFAAAWYQANPLSKYLNFAKGSLPLSKGMTPKEIAEESPRFNSADELNGAGFVPGMRFVGPSGVRTIPGAQ